MNGGPRCPGPIGLVTLLAVGVSLGACGDDQEGIGEDTLDRCTDNIDNDHDGLVDCRDPRCSVFARCADDDGGPDGDADADADLDADSDVDADSDSDTDGDTDVDSDECADEEEAALATYDTDGDPKTPEQTVSDITNSCTTPCSFEGMQDLCIAACIVESAPLSMACANCYEDLAYCTVGECLKPCLGEPDGPDCVACRCELGCVEIFEDCAGLPSPTKCP